MIRWQSRQCHCVSHFLQWWCGNNSSCSLWFVTKHSTGCQYKHYFNTVVVPGDRKGPGHQHNYNYHVRERERCAESGHQAGNHLSRENSVSQRRIYTPGLNIRWGVWPHGQAHHSEGCWPVISLVMSHHTSHLTPPATISIFPLTYWRLNRWTLGLQY